MGNTCAGLNFSQKQEEAKEQPPPLSVQHKPPEQIKIPEPGKKQEQPALSIQHNPLEEMKILEPGKKQEQPPLFVQHKPHVQIKNLEPGKQEQELIKHNETKNVTSARLCTDSILQRKSGNLKDFFTLGEKIGQGLFGEVFLCKDKGSGDLYACKSIAKTKLLTNNDVECVRREIQIMHHLAEHPNVISIKGQYEDVVAVHLIMELCTGGDLYNRIITHGHYTERKAAELTRTIVGVVEAFHSLGVMHRDLKPENFLLMDKRENAHLKVIDFGFSVFFKPGIH